MRKSSPSEDFQWRKIRYTMEKIVLLVTARQKWAWMWMYESKEWREVVGRNLCSSLYHSFAWPKVWP